MLKTLRKAAVISSLIVLAIGQTGCEGTTETTTPMPDPDAGARDMAEVRDQSSSVDVASEPDSSTAADASMDLSTAEDVGPDLGPSFMSAGCVDGQGLPEGENTFTLEDRTRRYIVRLPNGYTRDRAWPLVFALHGNGGSAEYWDGTSGDRNIRGVLQDDAILIVTEAIEGNWRDYNSPQDTWPARIESELLYFDALIEAASTNLCIDERAIFSMGFSGGGSFSGVLGCRRTDIRAIAVGGSVIYFDEQNCVGTPAAWITIGTEELSAGREDYRDWFRDRAGCEATSMDTEPAPCVAYDGCGADTPVHYCQHPDGHIWPDFGSQAMWDFFSQFVETE